MTSTSATHGRKPSLFESPRFPSHDLTPAQIGALSAFCDALFPSINSSGTALRQYFEQKSQSTSENSQENGECLEESLFYVLSAADNGIPVKVAELMQYRLKHNAFKQLSLVLWLLSTRIGTLILTGRKCITKKFPFITPFYKLPIQNRDDILISWSRSSLLPFRTIFKALKSLSLAVLFTNLESNGNNLLWKAIGYPGPDPAFMAAKEKNHSSAKLSPLSGSVVHLSSIEGDIETYLINCGFDVISEPTLTKGLLNFSKLGEEKPIIIKCEAIVIGSGSGGPVVASQLVNSGLSKLIIIEKGEFYDQSELSLLEGPTFNAMYDSGGFLSTEDAAFSILAGKTVGGGSRINWAASFKTPKHVTEEWSGEYGLTRYSTDEYESAMAAVTARLGVHCTETTHGYTNSILLAGSKSLGYPVSDIPRNAKGPHECNWCGLGCWKGEKQSTADTWIPDAIKGGAKLLAQCEAERVIYAPKNPSREGKPFEARGVLAHFDWMGKKRYVVFEAPVVIVAAGSIHTPAVLLRSGLKNPNIGRTLRLHPVSVVWGSFKGPPEGPQGHSNDGGIMTACCHVSSNWETSGYGALLQTPWVHPGIAASAFPWRGGHEFKSQMLNYARTSCVIAITRDKGHGRVRIDAEGAPVIGYTLGKEDEKHLLEALREGARVLKAAGAVKIGFSQSDLPTFDCGAPDVEFERFLERMTAGGAKKNRMALFSAHQTGSCRMGTSAAISAVDSEGESWEVENLYLGDGSVLATPPGVNPMITIQSVAYCIGVNLGRKLSSHGK